MREFFFIGFSLALEYFFCTSSPPQNLSNGLSLKLINIAPCVAENLQAYSFRVIFFSIAIIMFSVACIPRSCRGLRHGGLKLKFYYSQSFYF